MKKPSHEIMITPRDKKLLHYLFENRGATFQDIHNMFFHGRSRQTAHERIRKLRRHGFIKMDMSMDIKEKYYYLITEKGLKACYPNAKGLEGVRLKSPNMKHDLYMTKIRNILEKSRFIYHYYTENMMSLKSIQWEIDDIFKHSSSLRPDALFVTMSSKGPIYNAVELEISHKGSKDYKGKIQKYYLNRKIHYIIMITSSKDIENRIMLREKSLHSEKYTKFYYGNLESLLTEKLPFTFKNCRGVEYEF